MLSLLHTMAKRLLSPESTARLSAAAKKRWANPEYRAKMLRGLKIRSANPIWLANMRAAVIAHAAKPEVIAARKAKPKLSRPRTEDEKRRISALLKATLAVHPELVAARSPKGRVLSAEHRAKIARAHIGMKHTSQARAKMSVAKTGRRVLPPEHYQRLAVLFRGREAPYPKRRFYYRDVAFRSSWEMRTAVALDALGVQWLYESKRFDLGRETYCPDFYLPDDDAYWEVKGYYGPKSKRTIGLWRSIRPEPLVLVTESVLEMLERAASIKPAA